MPDEINNDESQLEVYQPEQTENSKAEKIKTKIRFTRFLLLLFLLFTI